MKTSFVLALKHSILNSEQVLMYVPKALVAVLSICCLHVILLSNVTQRYIIFLSYGTSRPFSCSMSSGTLTLLGK
jgi:hypothetical protein